MRDMIPAALLVAIAAPAGAQTQRGPDAHIVRPPRGDAIDVDGRIVTDRAKSGRSAYPAPYPGWKYRRLAPGEPLRAVFYGPRYVLAAPEQHGLPATRGTRRWIRYGDDAVLVDVRTGRVVKVLAGRCW